MAVPTFSSPAEHKLQRQRLDAAHAEAAQSLGREMVVEIVHSILSSMQGDISAEDMRLYKELEVLARYIHDARAELAELRPAEIRDQHIPSATDELDAVVGATEAATNTIMDTCDVIGMIASEVGGDAGVRLTDAVTRIFEACNFQDITGQRITKVVRTLKHIEARVDALLVAFGQEAQRAQAPVAPPPEPADSGDARLLHGPQLPANAIDQDEIDRLFASFD
jgi:chemotaxis protein CheZ